MSQLNDALVEIERLRQENDRLRSENAVLRPRVSDLEHRLRLADRRCAHCEFHPHPEQDRA